MASKRVKELEQKVAALEEQVRRLENMHAHIRTASPKSTAFFWGDVPSVNYVFNGKEGFYHDRQLTAREIATREEHPLTKERVAYTKTVPEVTHEELARYVLDGKPIERKRQANVVYTSCFAPDATTKSVKTDIGNISITEGRD